MIELKLSSSGLKFKSQILKSLKFTIIKLKFLLQRVLYRDLLKLYLLRLIPAWPFMPNFKQCIHAFHTVPIFSLIMLRNKYTCPIWEL